MKRKITLLMCLLAGQRSEALLSAAESDALTMTAQLVSPISSRINKKGDKISAIIIGPEAYRGAPLEGEIEEAKSSGDLKKTSSLRFVFSSLSHDGRTIPVKADVIRFQNSKGQAGVDEEGRIVKKSSGVGKAVAAAAIGATLGAIFGGARGGAVGAGVGLAAGFVFVSVAVKGPDITFNPDSIFELAVRPCERCSEEQPTLAQREFANNEFSFYYPAQWQAYWDGRSSHVKLAPAFGVVGQRSGDIEIGYGAMAGVYAPNGPTERDLASSTYGLIRVLKAENPDLEMIPGGKPAEAGDGQVLMVPLTRPSSLEAGHEVQLLVTMMRPQGLFYFIGIAPASRHRDVIQFSPAILRTLRFRNQ